MGWPVDWEARVDGSACPFCAGRELGALIGKGIVSDVWFPRRALVRGYAIVVWRGRHVVEPHHLNEEEAARYHADTLRVARAIETHFRPLKINYMTAGNRVPHLHTHVTARYRDDLAPGTPLPDGQNVELPEAQWQADAEALRVLLA